MSVFDIFEKLEREKAQMESAARVAGSWAWESGAEIREHPAQCGIPGT